MARDPAMPGNEGSRKREILHPGRAGYTNARISGELGILENTVRNHIAHLYEKLGVNTRGEAIALAYEHGFEA